MLPIFQILLSEEEVYALIDYQESQVELATESCEPIEAESRKERMSFLHGILRKPASLIA